MFPAGTGLDNCSGQVYGGEVRSAPVCLPPLEVGLRMGWEAGVGEGMWGQGDLLREKVVLSISTVMESLKSQKGLGWKGP